jgi:peptidyl-dipeptidase Dcp
MTANAATNGPTSGQTLADNPLLDPWIGPFEVPRFQEIEPSHFVPAFERAMAEHNAEIAAIVANPEPPTFDNTIVALEDSGRTLDRVSDVFYVLAGAHTNDAIQAVEREMSPRLSAHYSAIRLNGDLFRRVDKVMHAAAGGGLTDEQARVLERYHTDFRRAGAHLDQVAKDRLAAIGQRLASLGTAFSQNVLADERDTYIELHGEADLAGLPDYVRSAARQAAEARGLAGRYVITLSRSSVEPFLQYSSRRDLREKAFKAWIARGDMGGATDNKAIIAETVALRAERAKLLGFPTYADYRLDDSMAKTGRAHSSARSPTATRYRRWRRPRAAISGSNPGTGATTPRSCARSCMTSTRRRSSNICSSTGSSKHRSTPRPGCSACASRKSAACRSGIRTSAPGR